MSKFFKDTMYSLIEAVEITKGNVPLTERKDVAAPTYYVAEKHTSELQQLIQEQLKDSEFKKMWNEIQPEMNAIRRNVKKCYKRDLRRQRKRRRERKEIDKRLK